MYVHEVLVNFLFKLDQEKVWLDELTVPPCMQQNKQTNKKQNLIISLPTYNAFNVYCRELATVSLTGDRAQGAQCLFCLHATGTTHIFHLSHKIEVWSNFTGFYIH